MRRVENQYRGVNAHLHSYLQQKQEWSVFHGDHITHLREAVQAQLPDGYFAVSERSLQIARDDLLTITSSRTIPDVGVYRHGESATTSTEAIQLPVEIPLIDTIDEPENVTGVAIYRAEGGVLGDLVTQIELLSPANKPPGSHYRQYLVKRAETLQNGVNLVELDYLHERRSPIAIIPDYTRQQPGAYPYLICISRPYPTLEEGKMGVIGFRVDDPLPTISIPLDADKNTLLDLGGVYHHTYQSNPVYGLVFVDYSQPPLNLSAYDAEDQRRIQAMMARV